jgi:hypothetical protein
MRVKDYIAIGCIALALLVCAFILGRTTAPKPVIEGERTADTVTKVVPVYKDFPNPVKTVSAGFAAIPAYRFLTDTVTNDVTHFIPVYLKDSSDTVFIPREQKFYSEDEGRLRLWVSGVDPSLDRWELDRIETTISETVYLAQKRWNLDLFAGSSGTFASQPLVDAQVGLELRYEPNQWGFSLLGGYEATMVNGKLVMAPFIGGKAKLTVLRF